MRQSDWRKSLGNTFIGIGLILLLGAGGVYWWEQWQAQSLRAELQAEPTLAVAALAAPAATITPAPTVVAPAVPPTRALTAVPTAAPTSAPTTISAAAASVEPGQEPTATPVPTSAPVATANATPAPTTIPPSDPVRVSIPDLKIDIPVTEMGWKVINTAGGPESDWQIPENAAGHAVNSALLGEPGNMVISGHNNIYGRVFMRISQAWPDQGYQKLDAYTDRASILNGRQVILTGADGRRVQYVITAFYRVKDTGVPEEQRLKNADYMAPTDNMQLTLTTCWPPWSNTHRLIVIAQPVS